MEATKKRLLVFAHRLEAQTFLQQENWKNLGNDFFLDEINNNYLLITGEGIIRALMATSHILAQHGEDILEVVNLGVCGTLRSKECAIDQFLQIRTVYRAMGTLMDFHSFTAKKEVEGAGIDCVSSEERVTGGELRQHLRVFASLVDRELWGVAQSAYFYRIPWRAYKLVVDDAQQKELCHMVKEAALSFAEKIYQNYQNLNLVSRPLDKEKTEVWRLWSDDFYFTQAQKNLFAKYEPYLKVYPSEEWEDVLQIESIKASEQNKKERTKLLLATMKNLTVVSTREVLIAGKELLSPLKLVKAQLDLEKAKIFLHASISNAKERDDVVAELKALEIEKLPALCDGEKLTL